MKARGMPGAGCLSLWALLNHVCSSQPSAALWPRCHAPVPDTDWLESLLLSEIQTRCVQYDALAVRLSSMSPTTDQLESESESLELPAPRSPETPMSCGLQLQKAQQEVPQAGEASGVSCPCKVRVLQLDSPLTQWQTTPPL